MKALKKLIERIKTRADERRGRRSQASTLASVPLAYEERYSLTDRALDYSIFVLEVMYDFLSYVEEVEFLAFITSDSD